MIAGDHEWLVFTVPVDPAMLRVNLRFKSGWTLPPVVREAREQVVAAARAAVQQTGWLPGDAYVGVELVFYVDSRREDTDGPVKRVLDAVAEGAGFNDARVKELFVRRKIVPGGNEHILVRLYQASPDPGEVIPASWKENPRWKEEDDEL